MDKISDDGVLIRTGINSAKIEVYIFNLNTRSGRHFFVNK